EAADARKLPMDHTSIGIQCEGKTLAIERRPFPEKSDRIQLQLDQLEPGEYVLSIQSTWSHPTIHTAFIVDRYANNQTPMELNAAGATDLTFTVTADASSKAADRFSIVFDAPVLQPFSFKRVNANVNNNTVSVNWEVAYPEQVRSYHIERRLDPKQSFVPVRTEANNAKAMNLQTSDLLPMNWNQADYRVVATLMNGQTVASADRRVIRTILLGPEVTVMPNPVTTFTLQFQTTDVPVGPYKLKITNASGVVIDQETVRVTNRASSLFSYPLPATMAPGVYEISLMGEGVTISNSFIKQ
ncbi:MAG TPA: T9SS type A sorting domain-containing protein, partial [Ferruginibacter sp.]|nr:T9SS type A sorting domain-containing protein [Ferruginibacter sp.]